MKSKRATGNQFQDWVCRWLMSKFPGGAIHNQKTSSAFIPRLNIWTSKRQDILGCIDIIFVHSLRPPMFIQATTHTGIGKKQNDLLAIPWSVGTDVQIWQKVKTGRIVVWYLDHRTKSFCVIGEIHRGKWIDATEEMNNPCKLS